VTASPIVTAADLCRRFGEGEAAVDALDGVTLELPAGAFTAIMGPSGSGKSTLMHCLAGLDKPTGGTVAIDGVELGTLDDKKLTELRRDKVGFIFQSFNLLPVLTAQENIELPLKIAGRNVDGAWRDQLVTTVGLQDRLTHHPSELSGGQQQRVAVARALISKPAVVFADEPTGNLDSKNGEAVMDLLKELHTTGATICMVTHDARYASHAERTIHLFDGRVVEESVATASH
jgi:putative ABC transport system ATP-binding protein